MTWLIWLAGTIILLFGFVVFRGAPYVPSHRREVERAFNDLYPLSANDIVVDVGSGDGIILRLAAARGVKKAIGYELNPLLVGLSKLLTGGNQTIQTFLVDFWLTKLPDDVTLVYGFLVSRDAQKMTTHLQKEADRLNRPIYFMSYGSVLPEREAVQTLGAHHLYLFNPLQSAKA
jgi:SAM-dependent methyltransferase